MTMIDCLFLFSNNSFELTDEAGKKISTKLLLPNGIEVYIWSSQLLACTEQGY